MASVSISEAARLTGKARSTIHKYIKQGRVSMTTDAVTGTKSIDISELIRTFGNIKTTPSDTVTPVVRLHENTSLNEQQLHTKLQFLEQENQHLKREKDLLLQNLEDVRQAMLMIESKLTTTSDTVAIEQPAAKKSWLFWKK